MVRCIWQFNFWFHHNHTIAHFKPWGTLKSLCRAFQGSLYPYTLAALLIRGQIVHPFPHTGVILGRVLLLSLFPYTLKGARDLYTNSLFIIPQFEQHCYKHFPGVRLHSIPWDLLLSIHVQDCDISIQKIGECLPLCFTSFISSLKMLTEQNV